MGLPRKKFVLSKTGMHYSTSSSSIFLGILMISAEVHPIFFVIVLVLVLILIIIIFSCLDNNRFVCYSTEKF